MRSWGRGATAHALVAHLMWLGCKNYSTIGVNIVYCDKCSSVRLTAEGAAASETMHDHPSSLWVTSISNTETRAQLYICFVSGGHTIQHSLLPALRYNFFIYLNTFVGRKKQLIKSFYSVSATRLLVSSTCVLRTILFIAYTYWSLCSMSAFNDVTPI